MPATTATPASIVQTAARLFRERGFAATKMRDIAEAVGLSKAGVYHHYPSKEELLRDVVAAGVDALTIQLASVQAADLEPLGRLREFVISRMETIAAFQDELTVIWQERPLIDADTFEVMAQKLIEYRTGATALIEAARETGRLRADTDAHLLMLAIDGMTGWSYLWMHPSKGLAPRAIGEQFWNYVAQGVQVEPEPREIGEM